MWTDDPGRLWNEVVLQQICASNHYLNQIFIATNLSLKIKKSGSLENQEFIHARRKHYEMDQK